MSEKDLAWHCGNQLRSQQAGELAVRTQRHVPQVGSRKLSETDKLLDAESVKMSLTATHALLPWTWA